MAALLEVKRLVAFYGETKVLHGVDFSLQPENITTLLGANGAGKTTTLRAICGMVKTKGEIIFRWRFTRGQSHRKTSFAIVLPMLRKVEKLLND